MRSAISIEWSAASFVQTSRAEFRNIVSQRGSSDAWMRACFVWASMKFRAL